MTTNTAEADYLDYVDALNDLGISAEMIANIKYQLRDVELINTEIKNSNIHGFGVFAKCNIPADTIIDIALDKLFTTQVGRYVNHSKNPNSSFRRIEENVYLYSMLNIIENTEITIDYRTLRNL